MTFDVVITRPARMDFERTVEHIAMVLDSPRSASDLANEYKAKLDLLRSNPFAYAVDKEMSRRVGVDVRRCLVKRYAVWFTVEGERVVILAFCHQSRGEDNVFSNWV